MRLKLLFRQQSRQLPRPHHLSRQMRKMNGRTFTIPKHWIKLVIPLTNARIENPNTPALSPVFGESICAAFCTIKLIPAGPAPIITIFPICSPTRFGNSSRTFYYSPPKKVGVFSTEINKLLPFSL